MGKWATYRKRGSGEQIISGPQAPPAPFLTKVGHFAEQLSFSSNDTGGTVKIEISYDGGLTWNPLDSEPWTNIHDWDASYFSAGSRFRVSETGNGTDYIGTSDYSNILVWS
jgi:hypothetical protein